VSTAVSPVKVTMIEFVGERQSRVERVRNSQKIHPIIRFSIEITENHSARHIYHSEIVKLI
jgi:hypothetical protein